MSVVGVRPSNAVDSGDNRQTPRAPVGPEGLIPPRWLDIAFLLLPFIAAAGIFIGIPDPRFTSFCAYCLLVPALGVYTFYVLMRHRPQYTTAMRLALTFSALVIIWSMVSYFWSFDKTAAINEGNRIIRPVFSLIAFTCLGALYKGLLKRLIQGLGLAFLLSLVVAAFDFVTKKHFTELMGVPWIFPASSPTAFFYNPNNYACFLIAITALIMVYTAREVGWKLELASYAVVLMIFVIVFETQSRAGLLGVAAVVGFVILVRAWRTRGKSLRLVGSIVVAGILLALVFGRGLFVKLWSMVEAQIFASDDITKRSDELRVQLSERGWAYFVDSGFMGNGPGSFMSILKTDDNVQGIMIVNAHNIFIEIASQYGFIVLATFLCMLGYMIAEVLRRNPVMLPEAVARQRDEYRLLNACLVGVIIISGIVQSSVFADFVWWMNISIALLIADQCARLRKSGAIA